VHFHATTGMSENNYPLAYISRQFVNAAKQVKNFDLIWIMKNELKPTEGVMYFS